MASHDEIIDNLKVICQCKGIKKGKFKQLIADGAKDPAAVSRLSGAGTGSCGGKRCAPRIDALLEETLKTAASGKK